MEAGFSELGQDTDSARSFLVEALEIARLLKVRYCEAEALRGLGIVAKNQGDYTLAKQLFAEAAKLHRMLGNERMAAATLLSLGIIAFDQGDYDSACRAFSDNLELLRKHEETAGLALTLACLGNVAAMKKDYSLANSLYEEGLPIARISDKSTAIQILCNWGYLAHELGDTALAISRNSEALEMARQIDDRERVSLSVLNLGYLFQLTGDTERSRTHLLEFLRLGPMAKRMYPLGLEYASRLASAQADRPSVLKRLGTLEHAVRLYAAAQGIRDSIGAASEESWVHEHVSSLRDAVDAPMFEAAWEEGLAMTFDQAIAYAADYLENGC
jgi:tetratricopeptide (TPR) repeat protein